MTLILLLFSILPIETGYTARCDCIEYNYVYTENAQGRVEVSYCQLMFLDWVENDDGYAVRQWRVFHLRQPLLAVEKDGNVYRMIYSDHADDRCVVEASHFRVVHSDYDRETKNRRHWGDMYRLFRDIPLTPNRRAAWEKQLQKFKDEGGRFIPEPIYPDDMQP